MARVDDERIYVPGTRFLFSMGLSRFHCGVVQSVDEKEIILKDACWNFPESAIKILVTEGIFPKDTLFHPLIVIGRDHVTSAIPVQLQK